MTKTEQLDQLVSYFASGKKAEFARILGISKQNLNGWYTHEYLDIKKVFHTCPGLSADWLVTGEGEMLKKDRLPVLQEGEKLIPLIKEQDLLSGKWDNLNNYILFRTGEPQPDIDFVTHTPNDDLASIIAAGAAIGCKLHKTQEFKQGTPYILRMANGGTFFVLFQGYEDIKNMTIRHFKTSRKNRPNIKLSVSENDIVQAAEILYSKYAISPIQP